MVLDIFLALLAAAIAIVGTCLDKPKTSIKILLSTLAVATGSLAIYKAKSDSDEKKFMKEAVVSMLRPSNAEYRKVNKEIGDYQDSLGFEKGECTHNDDGMVCFFYSPSDSSKRATLVLDTSEVARMYGDEIAHEKNRVVAKEVCTTTYKPQDFDEDFKAKVAILGRAVAFELFRSDSTTSYDDSFGVRVRYDENAQPKELILAPDELKSMAPAESCKLFREIETKWVEKFGGTDLINHFPH